MTVPNERTRAVKYTHKFLIDLLDPKATPRVPKAIRQRAHSLLRHYPSDYDMDTIANREDALPTLHKVFGNSWK